MLDPQSVSISRQLSPGQLSPDIWRSFDAAEINRIVNDPGVFPSVSLPGLDSLDLTSVVADHRNVVLMAQGGAILFGADTEPGIYEVHTNFLEKYRGAHAVAASRNAYRWMFTHTDCWLLTTKVPAFNRPAAMAARVVGFMPAFTRQAVWPTPKGNVDLKFYTLGYEDWIKSAAGELIASGREFHEQIEHELARHGVTARDHPDEDCHDLRAGACLETVYGGQPEKAIILYNRWARFAGYAQINLIARSPLVIDIGDALLHIQDKSFKVIKCRQQP